MRDRSLPERNCLIFVQVAPPLVTGILSLLFPLEGRSQIIPVQGGASTQVSQDGNVFDISGGTQAEGNLFHQFESFSVGNGQTANFLSGSSVFNIIGQVSGLNPSYINGLLQVSGSDANLYLVNPAGILFGPNGQLFLSGSFAATTADQIGFGEEWLDVLATGTDYTAFTADPDAFAFTVDAPGAVVNQADLAVEAGESLVLMGGNVVSEGRLEASGGEVGLVSVGGDRTIKLGTPGSLLSLEVADSEFTAGMGGAFSAKDLPSLITGNGDRGASGLALLSDGRVTLLDFLIEPDEVSVTGRITTRDDTATGGTIALISRSIDVLSATVDASGSAGGTIRIGRGLNNEDNLPTADVISFGAGSVVKADGLSGAGGSIIIGSGYVTSLSGSLSAKGLTAGGFVETSANYLRIAGLDVEASGQTTGGQWLINPVDIEIVDTITDFNQVTSASIEAALDNNMDLTIATSPGIGGVGDISLLDSINQAGASTGRLTLSGRRFSTNGSTINLASTGGLTFNLNAVNAEATTSGGSVESAIAAIGSVAGDRTVNLSNGVYTFSNPVNLNTDVDIIGASRDNTVLNIDANSRLFIVNPGSEVSLSNLTFGATTAGQGGGVASRGTLTLTNILAAGNTSPSGDNGGAIDSFNNSRLTVSGSEFRDNKTAVSGGAIAASGTALNISNSLFRRNSAQDGGAISALNNTLLTVDNTLIDNNSAVSTGGGIRAIASEAAITNSRIENNTGDAGGGLNLRINSVANIVSTRLTNNRATASGGGISAQTNSVINISGGSLLEDNRSGIDGGGVLLKDAGSALTLDEVRFENNQSDRNGGGVAALADATVNASRTVFNSNLAIGLGGGLYQDGGGTLSLASSTLFQNRAERGGGLSLANRAEADISMATIRENEAAINGGGIHIADEAIASFANVAINQNRAGAAGGGAYQSGTGSLTVMGAAVEGNQAGSNGGAFATDGGRLIVSNAGVNVNSAEMNGGAIAADGDSVVEITGVVLNNNVATDGGGVYIQNGTLNVTGSTRFERNVATVEDGGGIAAKGDATVNVSDAVFEGNMAAEDGGGVMIEFSSAANIANTQFSNNSANDDGGGLYVSEDSQATVSGGQFSGNHADDNGGGAYISQDSSAGFEGTSFALNTATANGGGLMANSRSTVEVSNATFKENTANFGGGLSAEFDSSANINNSQFDNNLALSSGGGISARNTQMVVRDSEIKGNRTAIDGGGIWIVDGAATIENTNVNSNTGGFGGGLELSNASQVLVKNSELSNNVASIRGGGIQVDDTARLILENSTLANNQTDGEGGGLVNKSTAELVNTTLYGNEAQGNGGAIANFGANATTTVRNSTISENKSAGVGGGIASGSSIGTQLLNTIVAKNRGATANDVSDRFVDEGNNLIGQSDGSTGFTRSTLVGRVGSSVDPALAPLSDNGGLTRTQLLEQNSVAINAGTSSNLLATDQRGLSRVVGAAVDIGAVELTSDELPAFLPPAVPAPASGVAAANEQPERPVAERFRDPTLSAQSAGWIALTKEDDDSDNRTISQLERTFGRSFEDYWGLPLKVSPNFDDVQSILRRAQEEYKINSAIIYAVFLPKQIGLNTGENAIYVEPTPAPDDLLHLALVMPEGELVRYQLPVTRKEATRQVRLLQTTISDPEDMVGYKPLTQQLYRWLLAPLEEDLKEQNIQNLMYALDTGLRNAPVTAMRDYDGFSLERYGISVVPNMGLTQADFDPAVKRPTVAMGISQFETAAPLPAVPIELAVLEKAVTAATTVLNEGTTTNALESVQALNKPGVLHLATHANFDHYSPESSSISMWDKPLSMKEFAELDWLESDLELLILSACSTALSSANAELGFAGLAAAAGVDATVGSLWEVSDVGTLALMSEFYAQLEKTDLRFEALRQAQLSLLKGKTRIEGGDLRTSQGLVSLPDEWDLPESATLDHPFFWSAFTMVGNPW